MKHLGSNIYSVGKLCLLAWLVLGFAGGATATTYTLTNTASGTNAWTTTANWDANGVPLSATDAVVNIFSNTTTALGNGYLVINADPATLTLNTLTLNGLGAAATSATTNIIGTAGNTWTFDGTSPTINLNGLAGTKGLYVTVLPNLTLNQNLAIAGNGTAQNFTFSGTISGSGMSLTKSGSSLLTLSGNNSYSGGTTVSGGTLYYANNNAFGTGSVTFTGNVNLTDGLYGTPVTNQNNITINSGVTVTLAEASTFYNTYFGGVLSSADTTAVLYHNAGSGGSSYFTNQNNTFTGTIKVGQAANNNGIYVSSLGDAGKIEYVTSASQFGLAPSAAAAVTFNTRQVVIDSGATSATIVNNATAATSTLTIASDLVVSNTTATTLTLGGSNTGTNTFGGMITNGPSSGVVGISISTTAPGKWALTNANSTFTGPVVINGGNLMASSIASNGVASALGKGTAGTPIKIGGNGTGGTPTLYYTGGAASTDRQFMFGYGGNATGGNLYNNGTGALTFTATPSWNVFAGGTGAQTIVLGGTYSGGVNQIVGAITNNGTGGVTKAADASIWNLSGVCTYPGPTTISGGTLLLSGSGSLANSSVTVAAGATFVEAATATIGGATNAFTSSGTTTLNGTNTYGGATTVSAGTLTINGSLASASAVTVSAGATLGGTGTIQGVVTNNGTIAPGGVGTIGQLTLTNVLAYITNNVPLTFDLTGPDTAGTTYDQINGGGTLKVVLTGPTLIKLNPTTGYLTNGTYYLITNTASMSGTFVLSSGTTNQTIGGSTLTLTNSQSGLILNVSATVGYTTNNLTWRGTNTIWDINTTYNWTNGVAATTYADGNVVTFDDTGTGTVVGTNLSPAGVIFNNSSVAYGLTTTSASGMINGSGGVIKFGSGTVTLYGTNNYTGNTIINAGTVQLGNANPATTMTLGSGGTYAGNIYIASGATLKCFMSATEFFSGIISGGGNLVVGYTTLTLSNNNTYTGQTSILPQKSSGGGQLNVASFNSVNGGTPLLASSSLGCPTTVANGTIVIGNSGVQSSATLKYTGAGETTDRVINFGLNNVNVTLVLDASGTGLLKFTSAPTLSGSAAGNLQFQGTGNGEFVGGLPFQFNALTKSGAGTWTFDGVVSNTGPTAVTAGTLLFNGNNLTVTSTVTVATGATFGGTGTIGGKVIYQTNSLAAFTVGPDGSAYNNSNYMTFTNAVFMTNVTVGVSMPAGLGNGTYVLATNLVGFTTNGAPFKFATNSGSLGTGGTGTVTLLGKNLILTVSGVTGGGGIATTNLLTTSGSPAAYSATVTFTSTVQTNSPLGTATAAGSNVVFSVDGTAKATNAVISGVATYSVNSLVAGGHTIQAVYLGDGTYLASTNTVSQTITQLQPMTQTAPVASAIISGQALSSSVVTGGVFTNLAGMTVVMAGTNFVTPSIVPNAGTTNVSVYFVPVDTTDYLNVTNVVTVLVNAAAPAKFSGINVSGTGLTLSVTNGVPNGVWTLLESTNLLLPVSQWPTNRTGNYDVNGSLTTNILNAATNPQAFYLLK